MSIAQRTKSLFTIGSLTLLSATTGCVAKQGRFESNRFQHANYPYAVWYSQGAGPTQVIGKDWQVDNFYARDGGSVPTEPKTKGDYEVRRNYDTNGDGSYESARNEPFYDLLLKHREKHAALWVRSVPVERSDADKDLTVFAERYLATVASTGSVIVRFGADAPTGLATTQHATRKLGAAECSVTDKQAYRVDFEVADVEEPAVSAATPWSRGSVVIVRPGYSQDITNATGKSAAYPVLILIGMSARTEDFAALEPDFEHLLSQIVLSDLGKGLPLHGKHTCQLATASAGGEANVPR